MITERTVFERVRDSLVKIGHGDVSTITPATNLARDLEMDSLDIVELEMALEEEFSCDLTDVLDALEADDAVETVVSLVEKELARG